MSSYRGGPSRRHGTIDPRPPTDPPPLTRITDIHADDPRWTQPAGAVPAPTRRPTAVPRPVAADRDPAPAPGRPRRWLAVLIGLLLPAGMVATAGVVWAATTPRSGDHRPAPERSAAQPAPAAGTTCALVVPADPLSATGLATPYRLLGPRGGAACRESTTDEAAYVQATVIDPATGALSVYNPLVVDGDDRPAAPPVVPRLPAGAVVGLWFGFNGDTLTLRDSEDSLSDGHCVQGLRGSPFGQFSYCNAPAFFTAARAAIAAHLLTVPDLGTGLDGLPCPSTRDFGIVDQDQSDNVTSTYLAGEDGSMMQNTNANRATAGPGTRISVNGSDNRLLDAAVDPALGCAPFTAPDLADPGEQATSLALNELQAAAHQRAPVALTPLTDPMTMVDGQPSTTKTNRYRAGVDQPALSRYASGGGTAYCRNLSMIGQYRIQLDRDLTSTRPSPDATAGDSLFTFLAARLKESFDNLGCGRRLRMDNPVTLTLDGDGVAVDAAFATPTQPVPAPARPRTLAQVNPDAGLPVTQPGHF